MPDKEIIEHRKHKLVIRFFKDMRIFKGAVYDEHNKALTHTQGGSYAEVKAGLEKYVDDMHVGIANSRKSPPEVTEYVRALNNIRRKLPDSYLAMLKAHFHAPNRTLSLAELAIAGGYKDWQAVNLHYGKLGYFLNEEVPVPLPTRPHTDLRPWAFNFATVGDVSKEEQYWRWTLKPEFAAAIEHLGLQN